MKVLMIGLSDGILHNPVGDVRERHIEYARRVGRLDMIVYSPRRCGLEVARLTPALTVYPSRSLSRWHFINDAFRLGCRIMDQSRADIVTTQDPFTTGLAGYLLKRRFGVPLEVQNHSDFFDNRAWIAEKPCRYRVFNALGKFIIRRADALRVINREEAGKYLALGIPKERVQIQATPINVAHFRAASAEAELRRQLGLAPAEQVVLWVGRPVAVKYLQLWLNALKLVHRQRAAVRGLIVGDLNFAPNLPGLARSLGLSRVIIFSGRVAHEHLPAYFALADVYLHTSVYEGLGKVLVEAGAAGCPVVTTPTAGGLEVVLPEKTGIISEAQPQALADNVLRLLEQPELGRRMGAAAQSLVSKKFDRQRSLANIVATWYNTAGLRMSK